MYFIFIFKMLIISFYLFFFLQGVKGPSGEDGNEGPRGFEVSQ